MVKARISVLEVYRKTESRFQKPLISSEIGYRSINGTNKQPWNFGTIPDSDNSYDPQEQADCYEAFFRVMAARGAEAGWHGCFIWGYGTSIHFDDKGYTPINKPAEGVIRKWYSKG